MTNDVVRATARTGERFMTYPLVDALRDRRSRRFGRGMNLPGGPLAYASVRPPEPLTEDEEAALAFAACGITGYALADLDYGPQQGGDIMVGLTGRTVPSGDSINSVAVVVTNDEGAWYLRRPQDIPRGEVSDLIELARRGEFTELYRRNRVRIKDDRAAPPVKPGYNIRVNQWSLYAEAGSYFLPINDLTGVTINVLLEAFSVGLGIFIVDERNGYRPAGLERFARSRGGHLVDDPKAGRTLTIQGAEMQLAEAAALEQGMVLQNLALMTQGLGLGGFPNYASHPSGWFEQLGFRLDRMPASRFLGARPLATRVAGLLGRDADVPFPLGLEHDGRPLFVSFRPPYYPSMAAAVRAYVDLKFGPHGTFRDPQQGSAWSDPALRTSIPSVTEAAIEATVAYCEYVFDRYGRFPAYSPPLRTIVGFQAVRIDPDFYHRFYQSSALSPTQIEREGTDRT
jgi:hypothetical protein